MSVERRKPNHEFIKRKSNFTQSYEVKGKDLIVRTGRNYEGNYLGEGDMTLGKVLFDELRQDYHVPVVRTWMMKDQWINPGYEEYVYVVPRVNPYEGDFSKNEREQFIAQARILCDNLSNYYEDSLKKGGHVLTDINARQFLFGAVGNRPPQLWLVDIDPILAGVSPYILSEPIAEVGVLAKYFGWLTGEDFDKQIGKALWVPGMNNEVDWMKEYIDAFGEDVFQHMPTAYLRDKLIVR